MIITNFADLLAARIRAEQTELASRWVERQGRRLQVETNEVVPGERLRGHIPALIADISAYVSAPEEDAIAADMLVVERARAIGALRHRQQASLRQLLREYQLLGGVLVQFVQDEIARLSLVPPPQDCVTVVSRIHHAVAVLMQETVETFVCLTTTMPTQAERLEQFTRMATHEWRQPLGALQAALALLRRPEADPARARRTLDVVDRNVADLVDMTKKLERLARLQMGDDRPVVGEVSIRAVALEAARQVQDLAAARGVEVRVGEEMPALTVDAGRLELAIVNLLSNAIKYSDASKAARTVEVVGAPLNADACQIVVRDNGVGIPADRVAQIFGRFSRAHAERDELYGVTGMGLGLVIVDDCLREIGGQIEVESREGVGTVFLVILPVEPSRSIAAPAAP